MSMSAAFRDRTKDAGIAGGRVFRDERPQGTPLPAVRLQVVSDPRPSTYDGPQRGRGTLLQADCMGGSRGEADAVAEALIALWSAPVIAGEIRFERCFCERLTTSSERSDDGKVTFLTSLDFRVWHQLAA